MNDASSVSIIIPVLNEAQQIDEHLQRLREVVDDGVEIIVVDGGSRDETFAIAQQQTTTIISHPGRAIQMNAGADRATGELLLFLHADTRLPADALDQVRDAISQGYTWGRFDVRLSGSAFMFRIIERMMNLRSRLTSIATGDQAIFVTRSLFDAVGGYEEVPLMEDVSLSARLRQHSRPFCSRSSVVTSSRRWEQRGILRTILLMWKLRLYYAFGVSPDRLARMYR